MPSPAQGPDDNVLQLNLTEETLDFSGALGSIPNRGFAQGDITFNGIPYVQKIDDVTDPAQKVGIHFEPGVWLNVPPTTVPAEGTTVVRMASIPHGTTIDAQGTAQTEAGPPQIKPVDITPFPIGADPNDPAQRLVNVFPSQKASDDHTFRIPQDLKSFITAGTITQQILDDPNTILRSRAEKQNITSTTTIEIATKRPVPPAAPGDPADPLFGGGTANIAFLLGDENRVNPNADAAEMTATFWIETVVESITVPAMGAHQTATVQGSASAGHPVAVFSVTSTTPITEEVEVDVAYTQIQYTQSVLLNFASLSWPHVSVATLVPEIVRVVLPGSTQTLLRTYTVVAGDTLSGIAVRFYGSAGRVPMLAAVNGIADPDVIEVGQVLIIPDESHLYTVVAGDTLSGIAVRFYGSAGRVPMLAAVNGIADPDVIEVGQVLIIPDESHSYTVVAGDTLFGIALRFYGVGSLFGFIAEANGIANPHALTPGRRLVIPSV
jgi:nucleoid-associated protein YgaU